MEQKNIKEDVIVFPRFLSNKPEGIDLFEGQSQKQLACTIAKHIKTIDNTSESPISRLIGLEGNWGVGKSNVIGLLRKELEAKYNFFCFDAWGNQEDLQRRSILELLTNHLIENKKLTGETTMRIIDPKMAGKVKNYNCSWSEKLESLLSRKSYTKNITIPSVNNWTKIFVLMLLVTGLMIPTLDLVGNTLKWWVELLLIIGPMLIFLLCALCRGKLKEMWDMYNTDCKSETTSFVISEQEPSIREFKDWMDEISKGLPDGERLVVVFDNMDRLPARKVQQSWSLIQTFFADSDYHNIWCIIPYDEIHLAAAFSKTEEQDNQIKLLHGYLDKTFPVVYHVAEPIISDYKTVFSVLFSKAFGNTIEGEYKEIISRCYRHKRSLPNVREIITFINEMVSLSVQWGTDINPISLAIFILTKDDIFHGSHDDSIADNKKTTNVAGKEEFILRKDYLIGFEQFIHDSHIICNLPKEISALTYGIKPNIALQLVIKRFIQNCFTGIEKNSSITEYASNEQFMTILEDEVYAADEASYETVVRQLGEIDDSKLTEEGKRILSKIWYYYGDLYITKERKVFEFTDYEKILFSHVSKEIAERCAAAFCKCIIENTDVKGGGLFIELDKLFNSDFAITFDVHKTCPKSEIDAKRFIDFVEEAATNYCKYPITAKNVDVSDELKKNIRGDLPYMTTLMCLKDDNDYDVTEVDKYSIDSLEKQQVGSAMAYQFIRIQRLFHDKLQNKLDPNYVQRLWQEVQGDNQQPQYEEIYVLKVATAIEQLPEDERHIEILTDRILFYTSTTQLLKTVLSNRNINCRRLALKTMVLRKIHDSSPDYQEFIENWSSLVTILGIDQKTIIEFADSWGIESIPEQAKSKGYFSILRDESWIDALLEIQTPLAKDLIEKCVQELIAQDINLFIQPNTANHSSTNWSKALQKLIGTEYINASNMGNLNHVAEALLDYAARNGALNDTTWNTLISKVNFSSISTAVNNIRCNFLKAEKGYVMTPDKFIFMHKWLEKAEMNNTERCTDTANYVLSKVIDSTECRLIILEHKDYYRPIIEKTIDSSSALHDKLRIVVKEDGEFPKYIRSIVRYDNEVPNPIL